MPPKSDKSVNSGEQVTTAGVMFTPEQFKQLLEQLTVTKESSAPPSQETVVQTSGNFVNCSSRFDGELRADVEAFLDAVITYKECAYVTDANALRGLTMLLDGLAATWWKGIKSTIGSWEEAVEALRNTYSRKLPPHLVFRQIFAHEQTVNESTEHFVCNIRSLISQLPYSIEEIMQIDMIYGLLKRSVRQRLTRAEITSYQSLLTRTRDIEQSLKEEKSSGSTIEEQKVSITVEKKVRPKCTYCKIYGHTDVECRKLAKRREESQEGKSSTFATSTRTNDAATSKPFKCFGCGTPGYIRSNCPNCSPKPIQTLEFSSAEVVSDIDDRPRVKLTIGGHHGIACIDTGAKASLAGTQLYTILSKDQYPFKEKHLTIKLADGKEKLVHAKEFSVSVEVQERKIPLQLLAIPEHRQSNMLLGVDFVKKAGMIVDIPNSTWHFLDDPGRKYPFVKPVEVHTFAVMSDEYSLREEECTSLSMEQRKQINNLLRRYSETFSASKVPTPYAEHTIKLTDERPIAMLPYRLSEPKRKFLEQEIEQMLQDDVIEECDSPYAAPVVLVPKGPDRTSYRVCIDYRGLNACTVPDRYPLPRLDDLLHEAVRTTYMTTLDLRSGYWQVPIRQEDRDKTGFVTPCGHYRFKRMPFGLRNAPSTFQRLVDRLKNGLRDVTILAYLDDIIIISPTFEQHVEDLQKVFDRLVLFKLHVNRQKCAFVCSEVKYLGHLITCDGLRPNPEKVEAILKIKKPRNTRELLTFLQTVSWFRKFIPGCAEVMKPLTELTKKAAIWVWGDTQNNAFEMLKILLTSAPVLTQADYNKPFILRTDASAYAIGAALLQGEPPQDRPVEYASRLLTSAERNYSTTEREALAVVWAVDKFRGYLDSTSVKIISDHQPLRWLMSIKSPSGRLARWALKLQDIDLQIDYTPGKCNAVADTLSRLPYVEDQTIEAYQLTTVDLPTTNYQELREQQLEDDDVVKIIKDLENLEDPVSTKRWTERGYFLLNGVLHRYSPDGDEEEALQVIPASQVPKILYEYHDSPMAGHYGFEKTYKNIKSRYYWSGMRKRIQEHVQECVECQKFKPRNQKNFGLLQTPVQNRRFEVISIDLMGPLPKTPLGEQWIFVVEDTCSRWIELFALKQATAEACARCLINEIILRYGTPRRVISDNGVQFVGEVMQLVAHSLGFKQNLTPAYHPEANPTERKNRDIKTQLAMLTTRCHTDWSTYLPSIRFAMNNAESISTGCTPAYLTFGRELRTPDDVERDLRTIVQNAPFVAQITPYLLKLSEVLAASQELSEHKQDRSKENADRHRQPAPTYVVGDKVLVDIHALSKVSQSYTAKFAPRRDGPYRISKVVSPTSYQIVAPHEPDKPLGVYHASSLTPFKENSSVSDPQPIHPIRRRGRPRKNKENPSLLDNTRDVRVIQRGRL